MNQIKYANNIKGLSNKHKNINYTPKYTHACPCAQAEEKGEYVSCRGYRGLIFTKYLKVKETFLKKKGYK